MDSQGDEDGTSSLGLGCRQVGHLNVIDGDLDAIDGDLNAIGGGVLRIV